MKRRSIYLYINDILDSIEKAQTFSGNMSFEEFNRDEKTQYAVIRTLEIIGEASKKIPQEIKSNYSDIPWKQISGIRDILIHEYFGINTKIIWKTIKEDLPFLKEKISKILNDFNSDKLEF